LAVSRAIQKARGYTTESQAWKAKIFSDWSYISSPSIVNWLVGLGKTSCKMMTNDKLFLGALGHWSSQNFQDNHATSTAVFAMTPANPPLQRNYALGLQHLRKGPEKGGHVGSWAMKRMVVVYHAIHGMRMYVVVDYGR
jgi:hypothetical protein